MDSGQQPDRKQPDGRLESTMPPLRVIGTVIKTTSAWVMMEVGDPITTDGLTLALQKSVDMLLVDRPSPETCPVNVVGVLMSLQVMDLWTLTRSKLPSLL